MGHVAAVDGALPLRGHMLYTTDLSGGRTVRCMEPTEGPGSLEEGASLAGRGCQQEQEEAGAGRHPMGALAAPALAVRHAARRVRR